MKWVRLLQRHGYQVTDAGAAYDPFALLAAKAQASGLPVSSITFGMGTALEYGAVKCTVSVTIHCPQAEPDIDLAAELAFRKGVELTNDGASHLGLPPLQPPEEP